jgi:glycosyltransferase involved in cell wall biosynthesis
MRLVLTFPFSLGTPGGGTLDCTELARHLARAGADVRLAAVSCTGRESFPRRAVAPNELERERAGSLARDGVELIRVDPSALHLRLDGGGVARAVGRALDQRPADAVLGFWHEAFFLPPLLQRRGVLFGMNAAASFSQFLGPGTGLGRAWRNRRLRSTFRAAAVVLARSEFTKREVVELAGVEPRRVRVIHLGVADRFHGARRERPEAVRDLLYYGSLTRDKGAFDAVEAVGHLARAGRRDWTLRMAGWGDAEAVRRAAAEHGVAERVELLGPLDHEALVREQERAQLALLPSHTESFGLANAESQAAGLPVVAYDVAAVPEVVERGVTGWLVPLGSTEGLGQALGEALADPEETFRRGLAGRERMARLFTWERAAEATLAALTEAGAGRGE